MKKLIDVAMFMSIFSAISLSSSLAEVAVYLVVASALFILGSRCKQLIEKVDKVYDHTLTHATEHAVIDGKFETIDHDVKAVKDEINGLKGQIEKMDEKLDSLMRELKRQK